MLKRFCTLLLLGAVASHQAYAQGVTVKVAPGTPGKFTELVQRPQMGWNTWNTFACNINEKLIKEAADALVSSGMRDAGYVYVNVDDCWQGERDAKGVIHEDPQRFPSGMKALADYVHAKDSSLASIPTSATRPAAAIPAVAGTSIRMR